MRKHTQTHTHTHRHLLLPSTENKESVSEGGGECVCERERERERDGFQSFQSCFPEAEAGMASEPSTQSRVVFQAPDKQEEPPHRKLGKLTVKYNRKDLQRRLDIEEWIDGELHLLYDCEEEEIPELEIDIDDLLELPDAEQRSKLQELLQDCGKPRVRQEDFINGLLYRMKGLRKMSGPLKK
ncbi:hypothetical protein AAFF_G00415180 [Aldrovandia affinis]|uniref:Protein phosphatase 1 regulatory subunit 14B n=1 Tax=Aldrovandia affinis TaxID=143900 RepID=A0AAD7SAT2_9TELE|nr:hypothetical protein AAFF_G00415180 [Aldrovandia affinis]